MNDTLPQQLPPLWQLWRNPVVWRYMRSRLWQRRTSFWMLLTLVISGWTVLQIYFGATRGGSSPELAARLALLPLIGIQGFILMFLGTGSVAMGMVDEKLAGVLDYQRMAPLTPWHKIAGYLFGLPIREYMMFALTLPMLAFIILRGAVPLAALLPVYVVFFTSTLLYHLTGMVAGMVTSRWRWSARLSQVLVVLLYIILPQLSRLGFVFFEFLTVRPVLADHIRPLLGEQFATVAQEFDMLTARLVPFFNLTLSGTLFSLLIQATMMVLFLTMLLRKWVRAHHHLLSKAQVLATFAVFQILTFGNLWPTLTKDISGQVRAALRLPVADEVIATAIPIAYVLLTGLLTAWLMLIAVPGWHDLARGERRRINLQARRVPWHWDEYPANALIVILALASGLCVLGVQHVLGRAGYYANLGGNGADRLLLPLAVSGALLIFGWTLAVYGRGQLMLSLVLIWLAPALTAAVLVAARDAWREPAMWIAAVSPAITVGYAAALPGMAGESAPVSEPLGRALAFGLCLMLGTGIVLHVRWRRRYQQLAASLGARRSGL